MNSFNDRTMSNNNNNNQQSISLESGLPSVGSIVSIYMLIFDKLKLIPMIRFGLQDVLVHNKQLIFMLILIIFVHILMSNQKKLFNGIIKRSLIFFCKNIYSFRLIRSLIPRQSLQEV
jgi:hypothetical protein